MMTTLGGLKLNSKGITVDDNSLDSLDDLVNKLDDSSKSGKFFKWLLEFPGTRNDSPFRVSPSDEYVSKLAEQNNLALIRENFRINNNDPLSIARKAIYELVVNGQDDISLQQSSQLELESAKSLDENNAEILYYLAIASDFIGDKEGATNYYDLAEKSKRPTKSAILNIIDIQAQLGVSDNQRLLLLSEVIKMGDGTNEKNSLIVDKFNFCVDKRFYDEIDNLWEIIKEWKSFPDQVSSNNLLEKYITAKETQAYDLAKELNYNGAIELIKPTAIASLSMDEDSISSSVANLIEWENIENPPITIIEPDALWKYQDNGIDLGTDWIKPSFDDVEWKEGPGKFGYGGDGETTRLNWGNNRNDKFRTYYFRHKFTISESSNCLLYTSSEPTRPY